MIDIGVGFDYNYGNVNDNFTKTGWSSSTFASPKWGASVATVTGCVYAQVRVEYQ